MRRFFWIPILILILSLACNLSPKSVATMTPDIVTLPTIQPTQAPTPSPISTQVTDLPPSSYFTQSSWQPVVAPLNHFSPSIYKTTVDSLPLDLGKASNPAVISGLTTAQMDFLTKNGFVVLQSNDLQFSDIRDSIAQEDGQPYYLTTDAAYHALHVTFDDLLAAVEKEALSPVMSKLMAAVSDQMAVYAAENTAPNLQSDLILAQNYLAVARKLFDSSLNLDSATENAISAQLAQIAAMDGKHESALIPGLTDDYGAYRPVGHYAGDPLLEHYFQGMTWLGRVAFQLAGKPDANIEPSKVPLLVTLALRDATVENVPADQIWSSIYVITDFMIGPSDDPGPLELDRLMKAVYGSQIDLTSLADESLWQQFLAQVPQLPAPQINSTFQDTSLEMSYERDWRFMGQRFTIDGLIFQQLITDKVEKRFFPTGLDLAAAYGSRTALSALQDAGEMDYVNYPQQLDAMQQFVADMPENFWTGRFYNNWQYAFLPQLKSHDSAYPPYMALNTWEIKDINSFLGSWAELKHDTILYSKMPEGLGGGGPPTSPATPSYVEPNPDVFYRLGFAARNLQQGLDYYLNDWDLRGWYVSPYDADPGAREYINFLSRLSENLEAFGQIAEKELNGISLTDEENYQILSCLEFKDCLSTPYFTPDFLKPDPIPVIAAVSGYDNEVLEAGVGQLQRIYVAVPINGQLQIAQGGIFSYYEFKQPRSDRLTDEAWRKKLDEDPPPQPEWYSNLVLSGGSTTRSLAFRIGDIYTLTEEGANPPLNLRAEPSANAAIINKLGSDAYLKIIAGPQVVGTDRWWQVQDLNSTLEGWVKENAAWYARSY